MSEKEEYCVCCLANERLGMAEPVVKILGVGESGSPLIELHARKERFFNMVPGSRHFPGLTQVARTMHQLDLGVFVKEADVNQVEALLVHCPDPGLANVLCQAQERAKLKTIK